MPTYVFACKKCKIEFECLCRFEEIAKTTCPQCNTKKVKQQITCPGVSFANPQESSRWDSFEYRGESLLEKAKSDRRYAESKSHMGNNPYTEIDDFQGGEGILR